MSEGGRGPARPRVEAEGREAGVSGREVRKYPVSPRLRKTCFLGDLTDRNLQLSPGVH